MFYAFLLGTGLDVRAEESSAAGRADIAVVLDGSVWLFELKIDERASEGAALAQLVERGYADRHRRGGRTSAWRASTSARSPGPSPPSRRRRGRAVPAQREPRHPAEEGVKRVPVVFSRYRIIVPGGVREPLGLSPGRKRAMAFKGRVELMPLEPIGAARAFVRGRDATVRRVRDRV